MSVVHDIQVQCATEQKFVVTAPDDEVDKLQKQLYQSLTREAEAYKKIKHLHDLLSEARTISSRSAIGIHMRVDSPDNPWGTDLSQNSEVSHQSPQPTVIVVNGMPEFNTRLRSSSQPSSPNCRRPRGLSTIQPLSLNQEPHPGEHVHPSGACYNGMESPSWSPEHNRPQSPTVGHLAPLPRSLSDVRKEREKPPPPNMVKNPMRSLSMQGLSKVGSKPTLIHRSTSPEPLMSPSAIAYEKEDVKNPSPELNPSPPISMVSGVKKKSSTLLRTNSQKGPRVRSNTSSMYNWLRRRKPSSDSANKTENLPHTSSIEKLFCTFSHTSKSIQRDSLTKHIDRPWTEVCIHGECTRDDIQYRNSVWDMFQEETKYLTYLLQPLEQVYKGFLEELHFHGILTIADVDKIFANLSELCELSSSVANDLFQLFEGRSGSRIAPNRELILAFSMFGHKFNPVYQRFCVNFEKQCGFVRALQNLPEFNEYLRVCRTHEVVAKKDLSDLLISPLQHQCHYKLLLEKVLKYTKDPEDKSVLSSIIKAFVVSLKELEANIDESRRSAELLELQETLSWPTVCQLDTDAYIPDAIQSSLSTQPSNELLASKDRQLVYKGSLKLIDNKGKPCQELHVFLFTDLLLLTELKSKKKESFNQLIRYQVFGHPLCLQNMDLFDIPLSPTNKHVFTLVEKTILEQRTKVYTLQAGSKDDKAKWLTQISHTQDQLWHRQYDQYIESEV